MDPLHGHPATLHHLLLDAWLQKDLTMGGPREYVRSFDIYLSICIYPLSKGNKRLAALKKVRTYFPIYLWC